MDQQNVVALAPPRDTSASGGDRLRSRASSLNDLVPCLDRDALASLRDLESDDEPDFVHDLIEQFVDDVPARVGRLAASIASGRIEQVEREAHTMKSSCASLGLQRVAALFALMERDAGHNGGLQAAALLDELRDEWDRARPQLEAERPPRRGAAVA